MDNSIVDRCISLLTHYLQDAMDTLYEGCDDENGCVKRTAKPVIELRAKSAVSGACCHATNTMTCLFVKRYRHVIVLAFHVPTERLCCCFMVCYISMIDEGFWYATLLKTGWVSKGILPMETFSALRNAHLWQLCLIEITGLSQS